MLSLATLLLSTSLLLAHPVAAQESDPSSPSVKKEQQPSVEEANATAVTQREPRAPTQQIDIRIYGGEPLTVPEKYAVPARQYETPEPVSAAEAAAGSSLLADGAAAIAAANREKAPVLASIGTAISQSLPAHAITNRNTPKFVPADGFNPGKFIDSNVDFRLNLNDESFLMESRSPEEARHRIEIVRERQRTTTVWQQNAQHINSMIGAGVVIILLLWWWLSRSSQTKTRVTTWTVRGLVLFGSFYLHWAFGLFMLLGLYTHVAKSHGRV